MNPKTISRSASHTDSQGRHLISLMLVLLLWCGSGSHVLCLSSVHCSFVKPHFVGREFRPRHQLLGNTEIWKPHKYRGDLETSQTKILVPSGTCWFTVLLYKHMHTNMYTYTCTHRHVHIHTCTQTCTHTQYTQTCTHTHMYTNMHTCTHVHKHVHIHIYTHAHIHMYTQTCTHTHLHTNIYTCTHAYKHAHIHMCTQTCTHTHVHTNIYTCTHVYKHIHTHVHTNMVHACHGTAHTYSMLNVCAHTYIHTQPAHTYIHTQPAVAGRLHCLHIHATVYMLQTCAMMESESTSPGDKAVCEDMQQHLEERDAETLSLTPPPIQCEAHHPYCPLPLPTHVPVNPWSESFLSVSSPCRLPSRSSPHL
jgi:hypothetical protein